MSSDKGNRKLVLEVRRMSDHIEWTDEPVYADHVPRFDIWVVKPHIPIRAVFINNHIDGFNSHYDLERKATIPCVKEPQCEYCRRNVRIRWDGFVFSMTDRRKLFILRVSEKMLRALKKETDVKRLRGIQYVAKRTGPYKNSPLSIELGAVQPSDKLPDPINIRKTVTRALGLDRDKRYEVHYSHASNEVLFHDFTKEIPTD